ncbi:Uncharacterized protein Fot_14901 [Forsythia ovata]|uniref:Uncharacterized protein n=1 Tax=Forsythia ovata TaxID=205694 RepID=A0ABD1W7M8_9LAMI
MIGLKNNLTNVINTFGRWLLASSSESGSSRPYSLRTPLPPASPPPTPRRPQLQPTPQQPKPSFITPSAIPTIQTPPPTTATTSAGAASTASHASAFAGALPPPPPRHLPENILVQHYHYHLRRHNPLNNSSKPHSLRQKPQYSTTTSYSKTSLSPAMMDAVEKTCRRWRKNGGQKLEIGEMTFVVCNF